MAQRMIGMRWRHRSGFVHAACWCSALPHGNTLVIPWNLPREALLKSISCLGTQNTVLREEVQRMRERVRVMEEEMSRYHRSAEEP